MEASRLLRSPPVDLSLPHRHSDPFLYVERQSRQLQQDLQTLLDAQSESLSAGLSAPSATESVSTGSLTPTPSQYSRRSGSVTVPVRQPPPKKVGLRGARRGILKSMHKLLMVKKEERHIIGAEISGRREALKEVDTFASKREGLQKAITSIQRDEATKRVEDLKTRTKHLEEEMRALELKLMEMRQQYRHMLDEMSQVQNSVDSKLSSYNESLKLVDADVQRFLRSPPIKPLALEGASTSTLYSLNPTRRTLEMAKEHWTNEQLELRKRKRKVDLEIEALKEGGGVWSKAISAVSDFEKMLADAMQRSTILSSPSSASPTRRPPDLPDADEIAKQLDHTTVQLQTCLELAKQKNWNLLICGIGAELEAFQQARPMLLSILYGEDRTEPAEPAEEDDVPPDFLTSTVDEEGPQADTADTEGPSQLSRSVLRSSTAGPKLSLTAPPEDDEPDPAWLLS